MVVTIYSYPLFMMVDIILNRLFAFRYLMYEPG